jgi:3-isopropylmalate/(R)-2-methylmalate dehydratase small subunit
LLIVVAQANVDRFMGDVRNPATNEIQIDVERLQVRSRTHVAPFAMSQRHKQMFLDGLDFIGASLASADAIANFERKHWEQQPWLQSVGAMVRARVG